MFPSPHRLRLHLFLRLLAALSGLAVPAAAQSLIVHDDVRTVASLTNTTVTLTGKSELHVTGAGDPIPGCVIHLNSPDAWLFLDSIRPSQAASTFLARVRVAGTAASTSANARVVQHALGSVIIPQGPAFAPLEVFDGRGLGGRSKLLGLYTHHTDAEIGALRSAISSYRLKRGYMATFAENPDGTGASRCVVAQDGDLEVGVLPDELNNRIRFVRVFPWRWTSKKGWAGGDGHAMQPLWWYNWNNDQESTLDLEYVPIRQTQWWPDYPANKTNVTHLLGFNEPDRADQANMSVDRAIELWPQLMASGLRLGAPAVSDGGLNWLYAFIDRCDALGYRVDFVPVHYYLGGQSAQQLRDRLYSIHQRVKRPLWVTEFNNGANWTCCEPTPAQNAEIIGEFIDTLDNAPFVERYSVFNWVGDNRRMVWDGGSPLPAGEVYRANASPVAMRQESPETGSPAAAHLLMDGDLRDASGHGHHGSLAGAMTYAAGKAGGAAVFDGADTHVVLSSQLGDSADLTFAAWVYWGGGADWQRIFDLGVSRDRYLFLSPKSGDGTLRFAIRNGGTEQQLNTAALSANVWTHVAVTLSGDTGRLYVNGVLRATHTGITINPADVATRYNYLGKSQFADPLFRGRLDDVRFLPAALSAAQLSAIVNAAQNGQAPQFATTPIVKADAVPLTPYTGSVAGEVFGGTGTSTLAKIGGPPWLAVAANGVLTGVPGPTDAGINTFTLRVSDATGASQTGVVQINVRPASGLVSRHSFDSTVRAAVGATHGATAGSAGFVAGRFGSAIDLDGADDFVTLPAGTASHSEITIAAWINWDGGNAWQRVFDFGNGTGEYLFLTPKSAANRMQFVMRGPGRGADQFLESSPPAIGQWVHVAVTVGDDTGRLYVDGNLVQSKTITFKPSDIDPASNFIGKSQWPDPLFNGRVDEFLVFNHALTPEQVAALPVARAPGFTVDPITLPTATAGQPYAQSLAGLTTDPDPGASLRFRKAGGPAWLTIDDSGRVSGVPAASDAGRNTWIVRVTDASGLADEAAVSIIVPTGADLRALYQFDGRTADETGRPAGLATGAPGYQPALLDRGIVLDGVDDHLTLPPTLVSGLSDVTIAARVRWHGGGNWQRIFDFGDGPSRYMMLTPQSAARTLRFAITTNGSVAGAEQRLETDALVPGEWTHVAVTLAGGSGTLYVNGAAVDSRAIPLDPAQLNPAANYLGRSQWPDPLFQGSLDEFRVYDRGLSASEVAALAAPPAAVEVPDPATYAGWAAGISFPPGQSDAEDDPDADGLPNLIEYLLGSEPLVSGVEVLPVAVLRPGGEMGPAFPPDKSYLTLRVRLRRERPGVMVGVEAAATLDALVLPSASGQAALAGLPAFDGEYEILTYYFTTAIEDSPTGSGFMRVHAFEK